MRSRRVPRGTFAIAIAAGLSISAWLWSEAVESSAVRRRVGSARPTSAPGVVVLGFANSGSEPNAINRWRARIAIRAASPSTTIVTSGGAVAGPKPEARLLAAELRRVGWAGPLIVEDTSATTWENVRNVIPFLETAEWIVIASNGLHAEKAREYLRRQRPDLANRLVRGQEHRFGEMFHVKPVFTAVGLLKLRAALRYPGPHAS
ncbi:YdcF family protein [Curtobacterium sp. 9128]|uniref:YdcF family protein n=1 Tax=Curtobacterium sp. 9128 TaxID=1793722 RepID=UPI00119E320B|nr:YdcF family protein [Curtobacterium sp. 9128]